MALTKASMATKILTKIQACNANLGAADIAIIQACLEAFCEGIIEEIQQNGSLVMDSGDFNIEPGSLTDSLSNPITGLGDNAAFNLVGKII